MRFYRQSRLACLALPLALAAQAAVTRIDISARDVVANGAAFGAAGPFEKLRGTAFFEVDPADRRNAVVFDLDKAPRNARGMVEFSADIFILKPVDLRKGNGAVLAEVANRGSKNLFAFFNDAPASANGNNPATAADFGNGFLLNRGYTLVWVGWSAGMLPGGDRLTAQFPVASQGGQPVSGRVLTVYWDADFGGATPFTLPIGGFAIAKGLESISTDLVAAQAELRRRPSDSPRPAGPEIPDGELVPANQWSFARCPNGPPGTPSTTDLCLAGGFQNNQVYELLYTATNSPISGLGYLTTRDFLSFLRNVAADGGGTPNPVAGISRVLCHGFSISGQYLRDFVYQGFNEDEQGRRVCDGAFVHSAGSQKGALNFEFATDPNASPFRSEHAGRNAPETNFPRAYAMRGDPLTGKTDGILKRPTTDPKIFHVDSATEYWQRRASLLDTDETGAVGITDPANVRRFLVAGTQHVSTKGALPSFGIANRQCQQLSNTLHRGSLLRALLVKLDDWVRGGLEPPASLTPRLSDATLVEPGPGAGFPAIPGVVYNGLLNGSGERNFGPRVTGNSGIIDNLRAPVMSSHRLLVPKVDAVGNDLAALRHPFVEAPVATLTGWSLRRAEFTDGDLCDASGMTTPLAPTRAERLASGDERPSLEELYGDQAGYLAKVKAAAQKLVDAGLLLPEDLDTILQEAAIVPTVPTNAIVSGGEFTPDAIAPGAVVAIFGSDLAGAVVQSPAGKAAPSRLFDVSVMFNDVPAPMLYASPGQINAQVPFEIDQGAVTVRVVRNLAASAPQSIRVSPVAPAILTTNQRGTGAGLAFHSDGITLVTETAPAVAGESLVVYCTGLGALKTALKSGELPPNPPPETAASPQMRIGGADASVIFSGAAPSLIGVYRISVRVPVESAKGAAVPMQLTVAGVSSNTVTVAIQ